MANEQPCKRPMIVRAVRGLLILLIAVVVGSSIFWAWLTLAENLIGPDQYHRIEIGMTEAQVRSAIGLPPGNLYPVSLLGKSYLVAIENLGLEHRTWVDALRDGTAGERYEKKWVSSRYVIAVIFDADDRVIGCSLLERRFHRPPNRSPLQVLRSLLGL